MDGQAQKMHCHQPVAEGLLSLREGRRLHGGRQQGGHSGRKHRPSHARPALERWPAPSRRGQGEACKVDQETQTLATITIQNYFRLYEKMAGMTGTAETEAAEFQDIYNVDVLVVPTNRPIRRIDRNDRVYKSQREKLNAVVEQVKERHAKGQPMLLGTASERSSEILSKMLSREKIVHNVLNAKHHRQEAEIVARAGMKGAVTVATNMAGRGTDIKLGPGVTDFGGLLVIGTERHTVTPHRPPIARPFRAARATRENPFSTSASRTI